MAGDLGLRHWLQEPGRGHRASDGMSSCKPGVGEEGFLPNNLPIRAKDLHRGGPKFLWFTEAPVGIEPTNGGFADLCLTTWLRRPVAPDEAQGWLGAEEGI